MNTTDPWVESREGTLFFANALLASPAVLVIVPAAVAGVLGWLGVADAARQLLEVVPTVALHVLPWVGVLAAPALVVALRTRRSSRRVSARRALLAFAGLHALTLAATAWLWWGPA